MSTASAQRTKVAYYGQPRAAQTPMAFGVPQADRTGRIDSGWLGDDVPATVESADALADMDAPKLVLMVNPETQAHEVWQLRAGNDDTDVDNGVVRSNKFSDMAWYRS
jgi:hypothetical protein